jgi:hypothetical protein
MVNDVGWTVGGETSHQFIPSWSLPTHPFHRSVLLPTFLLMNFALHSQLVLVLVLRLFKYRLALS